MIIEFMHEIYVLQAFDDVMYGNVTLNVETALRLGGLALQAEFGYKRQSSKGYFKPIDYLPEHVSYYIICALLIYNIYV